MMLNRNLLVGISALAFATGAAHAQTNNQSGVQQTGSGNSSTVCNDPAQSSTTCAALDQDGVVDSVASNSNNTSTVIQTGAANTAIVRQVGNGNSSFIQQIGDANSARHEQVGNNNVARTDQNGEEHNSEIRQGSDASTGTAAVPGNSNFASVTQRNDIAVTRSDGTILEGHSSTVGQDGSFNRAIVGQFGGSLRRNTSTINQTADADLTTAGIQSIGTIDNRNTADVSKSGDGNVSMVTQQGQRNFARVSISGGGAAVVANIAATTRPNGTPLRGAMTDVNEGNEVTITQTGNNLRAVVGSGRPNSTTGKGNFAQVSQTGEFHSTVVYQTGVVDTTTIVQTNTGTVATDIGGTASTSGAQTIDATRRAEADVSQNGLFGIVNVTQRGDNFARASQQGENSNIDITQVDTGDQTVAASTGNTGGNPFQTTPTADPARRFNTARVGQSGLRQQATVAQAAAGATAIVFQREFTVNAGQGAGAGQTAPTTTSTTQTSDNVANVRQGMGTSRFARGTGTIVAPNTTATPTSTVTVIEPGATPPVGSERFAGAENVFASVTQSGAMNSGTIRQNGTNLSATIEQFGFGSRAEAGTAAATASTADDQDFFNVVEIEQVGTNNTAFGRQTLTAGTSFANSPASGNTQAQNQANCLAAGGTAANCDADGTNNSTGNTFVAADDPGRRAGGRRASEILILQSGSSNDAGVEQQARGAFAQIEQSGTNNYGRINQGEGAVNAVAILRQSGSFNTFTINQNSPGEYDLVVQTGTANAANAGAQTTTAGAGSISR